MDAIGVDIVTKHDLYRHYVDVRKRLNPRQVVEQPKVDPDEIFGPKCYPAAPEIEPVTFIPLVFIHDPDEVFGPRVCRRCLPLSMHEVCAEVCRFYNVKKLDFFSARRFKTLVIQRQIAAWLCWKYTGKSTPAIGRFLQRDHTTILHANKCVEAMIVRNPQIAADIQILKKRLGAHEME